MENLFRALIEYANEICVIFDKEERLEDCGNYFNRFSSNIKTLLKMETLSFDLIKAFVRNRLKFYKKVCLFIQQYILKILIHS